MKLNFIEKLGDGTFADVWRARDELEREVAVKIIRQASVGIANALAHAKALARATHPNVVAVLTLESTDDPQNGERVDCIVMELVNGDTLETRLSLEKLSRDEVVSLGSGIIDGLAHIHAQGMTHGDLHAQNIMVVGATAKIIDILYLSSLASTSTEKRVSRMKRDLGNLRILLQDIITHSDLGFAGAKEFTSHFNSMAQLRDIRLIFDQITSPKKNNREQRTISVSQGEKTTNESPLQLLERLADDSGSRRDRIEMRFRCAPTVIPIYNEFNVELENREVFASLRSRLSLRIPIKVAVQLSDSLDYATVRLEGTPYQREDLIEAATLGVEKRRAALERRINWCLEAINANGIYHFTDLEQCIARLCQRVTERSGNTVPVDVVSHQKPVVYFRTQLPEEVMRQIAHDRKLPRPITKVAGCDLFDLPVPVIISHVLPSYAFCRDVGYELPDTFRMNDWCWGEA
ncbi:MAG: protein kinase domain-containing protein [Betaproteobacteria bacterium]